jgi:monovalent cation/hydrogen antiporter
MASDLRNFEITIALLALVLLLVQLCKRIPLPYPAVMALVGLLIAVVPGTPNVQIDPEFVLVVFLPPILYSAAWNTSWPEFKRNLRPITFLAIGLVGATMFAVAVAIHTMFPDMPWAIAILLGAIVSPPDAISATAIFERLGVPRRLVSILEGESLVNDAGALVAFRTALAVALTGVFSWQETIVHLLMAGAGGVAVGLASGALITQLHKRVLDPLTSTAISLVAPYAVYIIAEWLGASGVLAVVAAGILVTRRSVDIFCPATRLIAIPTWQLFTLLINGLAFTLIGLQVDVVMSDLGTNDRWLVVAGCAVVVAVVIIVRIVWVAFTASLAIDKKDGVAISNHIVVAWAGMRGVVSLAAAMSIPKTLPDGSPFPYRYIIVSAAFALVFCTLVLQGSTLPWLIRRLRVLPESWESQEHERAVATSASEALRTIGIESQKRSAPPAVRERLLAEHLARIQPEQFLHSHGDVDEYHGNLHVELAIRRCALNAEREEIARLRGSGAIGESTFRRLERGLDLQEELLDMMPLDEDDDDHDHADHHE